MSRRSRVRSRSNPKLLRRNAREIPKRRFVLFCEGSKTEPAYFKAIRRAYRSKLIGIKIRKGVGVPFKIATKTVEYVKKQSARHRSQGRLDLYEESDEVWAVFDRDRHPLFKEALDLCKRNGVHVAWSNPCFELWLLLHDTDYSKPNNARAIQRALSDLRPEYHRRRAKTPDCDDLVERVREAEERADKLLQRCRADGSLYGNPATAVGQLTRTIRKAAQKAYIDEPQSRVEQRPLTQHE